MVSETHEYAVDDVRFKSVMLDGVAGRRLSLDVLRLMGPAVATLAGEGGTAELMGAIALVKPEDVDRIVNVLGTVTQAEMEPGTDRWKHLSVETQKTFFAGRQFLQFRWIKAALEVQLADFFGSKPNG